MNFEFMNFAKYIVAQILGKFKYFAKQIISSNYSTSKAFKMMSYLSAFYEFCSHQNSKNGPEWTHFVKSIVKLRKSKYF